MKKLALATAVVALISTSAMAEPFGGFVQGGTGQVVNGANINIHQSPRQQVDMPMHTLPMNMLSLKDMENHPSIGMDSAYQSMHRAQQLQAEMNKSGNLNSLQPASGMVNVDAMMNTSGIDDASPAQLGFR